MLAFVLGFGFFRLAIADWNPIPSGSMRPTLLEGDVVLVNRLAYDLKLPLTDIILVPLGDPRRGDIVTFSSPADGTRLIKRIVAIPGDTVELRGDTLFVNGVAARYAGPIAAPGPLAGNDGGITAVRARERIAGSTRTVQFLPEAPAMRDFGPLAVPADCYFMMGDNRDDSEDSRYIGVVPRRLLIGRAGRLLVSADIKGHWQPRFRRFGKTLR
jgi:signal peptidase I